MSVFTQRRISGGSGDYCSVSIMIGDGSGVDGPGVSTMIGGGCWSIWAHYNGHVGVMGETAPVVFTWSEIQSVHQRVSSNLEGSHSWKLSQRTWRNLKMNNQEKVLKRITTLNTAVLHCWWIALYKIIMIIMSTIVLGAGPKVAEAKWVLMEINLLHLQLWGILLWFSHDFSHSMAVRILNCSNTQKGIWEKAGSECASNYL